MTDHDPAEKKRPSLSTVFSRVVRLKCPVCGEGKLFSGYFTMYEKCEHCHLKFEQEPGYFLGSTYINYMFTAGITAVTYIWLHFFVGIKRDTLMYFLGTFCVVFPILFFRYARSFWLGMDKWFETFGQQDIPGDD